MEVPDNRVDGQGRWDGRQPTAGQRVSKLTGLCPDGDGYPPRFLPFWGMHMNLKGIAASAVLAFPVRI